jgi:hypothetical protein
LAKNFFRVVDIFPPPFGGEKPQVFPAKCAGNT